jgi:hypothetical protein
MDRVVDAFAHLGMAVALHYTMLQVARMYALQVNLNIPLPPYPGVLVVVPRNVVLQ